MSSFKILELEQIGVVVPFKYTLDERTGYYKEVGSNPEVYKGLLDIVFDRLSKITKVSYERIEYKIGDSLSVNNVRFPLVNFKIIKNRLFVNEINDMITIKHFVEPKKVVESINTGEKVNNFLGLQKKLDKLEPLELSGFRNISQTLKSFIFTFIENYNNIHKTTYISSGNTQTVVGKRRSLGDIYKVCKNYYPDCTLHDVIQIMYVDLPKEKPGIASIICKQINKRVWWVYGTSRFDEPTTSDEYGHNREYYITQLKIIPKVVTPKPEESVLESIKRTFKIGTKFNSMQQEGKVWKVDSDNFYDGIRSIVVIQKDGTRKQVYDKNTKKTAVIIK